MRYSLELALRGLRRSPWSTSLAITTVALGLAACMTTLTLLHMLTADPLPGRSPHQVMATFRVRAASMTACAENL